MHPIFTLDDILVNITDAVAALPEDRWHRYDSDYTSLIALAQVSRVFSDPALKIVWRTCEKLSHLLMCFPKGVWGVKKEKLYLRRRPLPSEWTRVEHYAAFVKNLKLDFSHELRCTDFANVMGQLHVSRRSSDSGPLLPNISSLALENITSDIIQHCRLLFDGAKLPALVLEYGQYEFTSQEADFLHAVCPGLKCIHLESYMFGPSPEASTRAISGLVCGYNDLQKIIIRTPLTREAWVRLGTHPHLVEAELVSDGCPDSQPHCSAFPALKILHLSKVGGSSHKAMVNLICTISSKSLREVTIDQDYSQRYTDPGLAGLQLQAYCHAIATIASETLSTLYIDYRPRRGDNDNIEVTDLEYIKPLSTAHRLEHLHIETFYFNIDDSDIEELASWFPELVTLCLTPDCSTNPLRSPLDPVGESHPRITLRGVTTLIRKCKKLETLSIILSAHGAPPRSDSLEAGNVNNVLTSLHVMDSPISDHVTHVALALSSAAPSLRHITHCQSHDRGWYTVQKCLEVLSLVRSQWVER